jgi:Reverse transcriptase (RNA-dependent DNA polymerase)
VVNGPGKPKWLTKDIKHMLNQKRKAWKTLKREGGADNRERYTELSKRLKKSIQNGKRKLEKELAYGKDKNKKQFTRYVKSRTRQRAPVGPIALDGGGMATEDKEVAEALNKFFASVFTKEDRTRMPTKIPETDNMLNTVEITEEKVKKKIKNLRADSAAGPDGLHPKLLKETCNEIAYPLCIIFRRSLNENEIPTDWKRATVTPIYKSGTRTDPGNYRPVSLTSVPCKLLESIIEEEITVHLSSNKLISESQHGFMKGRSCATNIIEFMEVITKSTDQGDPVDIFYLDFSKAFDKVPRERLIVKLKAKGIQGELIDWLQNWLCDRVQTVKVRGAESEEQDVESGVPQGTVLGPCLFKVHIDDIDEVVRQLVDLLSKFADDTKGAKIIRNAQDAEMLQEALNKLCAWAETWGMSFNEKKCKIMHVGRNNPRHSYYMNGTRLAVVEEEKDVGVVIHRSLKPARQCERAAAIATGVLMQLVKCFHFRDRHIFLRLYTQYVRPHLEFATPAWSPWLLSDIQTLEKVQERAVKLIAGLAGKDYADRCKELGLETLQERRHIQDMAQVYKLVHNVDKVSRVKLFDHVPEGRTRLAADPLNVRSELCRTDIRKNFFTQRVINNWNSIDPAIKTSVNVHVFKTNYRKTRLDGTP